MGGTPKIAPSPGGQGPYLIYSSFGQPESTTENGISIDSAVFVGFTVVYSRQRDTQTILHL